MDGKIGGGAASDCCQAAGLPGVDFTGQLQAVASQAAPNRQFVSR